MAVQMTLTTYQGAVRGELPLPDSGAEETFLPDGVHVAVWPESIVIQVSGPIVIADSANGFADGFDVDHSRRGVAVYAALDFRSLDAPIWVVNLARRLNEIKGEPPAWVTDLANRLHEGRDS
jgi:hypothetical protein